jgi:outer membrane protein assembly factor BamB
MNRSMFLNAALTHWSPRLACAAGLLLVGWGWTVNWNHGVGVIQRAETPQNIPLALPRPAQLDVAGETVWQSSAEGTPAATPCLHGHLAVTPLVEGRLGTVSLWAVDRRDGRSLWTTTLHRNLSLRTKRWTGSTAPACDGQRIFLGVAVRGRLQLSCVDLEGAALWTRDLGPVSSEDGRVFTPLLHEALVIVAGENDGAGWSRRASHLTAVHRLTGEEIWRVRLSDVETCGVPALAQVAGRRQILMPSVGRISAFDPSCGKQLWTCRTDAGRLANTVAWNDRLVVAAVGAPASAIVAIRADGEGEVSATHTVWQSAVTSAGTLSPVVHQASVLCLGDNGHLTCLDLETGKLQWRKQLPGTCSQPPILLGEQLLCLNEQGAAFRVEVSSRGTTVQERSLATEISAPAAAIGRQLIIPRAAGLMSVLWDKPESPVVRSPDREPNRL